MKNRETDVLVIGGGAAGMAASLSAAKQKKHVTLLEREDDTGGVLNQCIHHGFGVQFYQEELTGPEFSARLHGEMSEQNVEVICESYVRKLDVHDKIAEIFSPKGAYTIQAKSVVLATGARERPFGALLIPGDRPAGIFPAGLAQRFVNLENCLPGRRSIILGSGDIGLIMARRLHLEGMKVAGVVERLPYPGGLTRNVVQCLEDFDIPLYLSHTITEVRGFPRLEAVKMVRVDDSLKPIEGTEKWVEVDTLILSAGLIPHVEDFADEEAMDPVNKGFIVSNTGETIYPGIFAAGNNVAIYDLVDYVAAEGWIAGKNAASYAEGSLSKGKQVKVKRGNNVNVLVPNMVTTEEHLRIYLRLKEPIEKGKIIIDELGIKKEFKYGVPSEMLQLTVNKSKLSELLHNKDNITVEVIS
ncbi:MAG: FAD-binding protein [Kosmotoga sp.]|nr:MAG: FAD-binding protein [Kosmotoga sp.]